MGIRGSAFRRSTHLHLMRGAENDSMLIVITAVSLARHLTRLTVVAVLLACLGQIGTAVGTEPGTDPTGRTGNYQRRAELPVPAALMPLPPGAVEPAGWLRDWARAAANGITGHLDEWNPVFRDSWKGVSLGDWPEADGTLEQSSYWLDGLARLGYALHDETLIRKAQARLDLVVDGVNRGGKSFVYWKSDAPRAIQQLGPLADGPGAGGLVRSHRPAARARRAGEGLQRLSRAPLGKLEFAADPQDTCPTSGLCNLDAMLETYTFSGERRLLERARETIGAADVQATVGRWLDGRFLPGHAVCAYELARLPALFYLGNRRAEVLAGQPQRLRLARPAARDSLTASRRAPSTSPASAHSDSRKHATWRPPYGR